MGTTTFVWDPVSDCVLMELDETDNVKAVYTNEARQYGGVLSQRRGSTSHYHHHDALGSTRFLTDSTGTVTDTYLNDAWGNSVASTGTTVNPFKWVGKYGYYTDDSTGQVYVRARMYQPAMARWVAIDKVLDIPRDWQFIYAHSSPVSNLDPSGHACCPLRVMQAVEKDDECNDLPLWQKALLNGTTCESNGPAPSGMASLECKDGKFTIWNSKRKFPPLNAAQTELFGPVEDMVEQIWKHGGGPCITEHENTHIKQYKCICPRVCNDCGDGFIFINNPIPEAGECWPHLVELDCYIRQACELARVQGVKSPHVKFLLGYLDLMGPQVAALCKRGDIQYNGDIPNSPNYALLKSGKKCEPERGVM